MRIQLYHAVRLLICLAACSGFSFSGMAQTDTSFWFVAPEVAESHGDRPIYFRFATLNQPALITIWQPANPGFPVQVLNLAANDAQSLDLTAWITMVENKPADAVLNYGFKISSTASIMAYYEVSPTCNCNPDIFTLKGRNALGTQFLIPFQSYLDNASYARSAFNIVATEDNTQLTIIPTQNIAGHSAGLPFNVTLNKGQTYCAEASSTSAGQHASGSGVIASKPVAVTISDDSMSGAPYGGCADIMGDQIVPISIIGDEYIAIKGYLNGPDKVYVLATAINTVVMVDGMQVATLQPTQTYVHTLSNPSVYITTSAPAYVLHTSGFGCEVGGALLPPVECTGSNSVAFVRSTDEFFALNILVPAGGQTAFTLDGNGGAISSGAFQFVPGTGNTWMYAQIDASSLVTPGAASRLENSTHRFHLSVIHGGASSGCRYGYFSDYAAYRYQIQLSAESVCEGDPLDLAVASIPGALYQWSGPDGFSASGVSTSIGVVDEGNEGEYIISGFEGLCPIVADTAYVTVNPVISESIQREMCQGESLVFGESVLTDPGVYTGTFTSSFNCDSIVSLDLVVHSVYSNGFEASACEGESFEWNGEVYTDPGLYPVMFETVHGCDSLVTLDFIIYPEYEVQTAAAVCEGGAYEWNGEFFAEDGTYTRMLQSSVGCDSLVTLNLTVQPVYLMSLNAEICQGEVYSYNGEQYSSSGIYDHLFETMAGCDSIVTLELLVNPIETSVIPVSLCGEEVFTYLGETYDQQGVYPVTLTSEAGCDSIVQINVSKYAEYEVVVFDTTCHNQPYRIGQEWFTQEGVYVVPLISSEGCDSIVTLHLHIRPESDVDFYFPNVITPNGDGKNGVFRIEGLTDLIGEYEMQIFNRWGAQVFSTTDPEKGWGGQVPGGSVEPGVYYFIARFTDLCGDNVEKEIEGNVTVME